MYHIEHHIKYYIIILYYTIVMYFSLWCIMSHIFFYTVLPCTTLYCNTPLHYTTIQCFTDKKLNHIFRSPFPGPERSCNLTEYLICLVDIECKILHFPLCPTFYHKVTTACFCFADAVYIIFISTTVSWMKDFQDKHKSNDNNKKKLRTTVMCSQEITIEY